MLLRYLLLVFSTYIFLSTALSEKVVVETSSGEIEGVVIVLPGGHEVRRFLGVPFAKPPVGGLRFRKPVPVEPWGSKLRAWRMKPGCVQHSPHPYPWSDDLPGQSEDCLYLNIWVPRNRGNPKAKRSVMFWLYTGGFTIGSTRVKYFDGTFLSLLGDVIVVTTNYRLGVEGFLYSGTEDAPGNMALWDMVESLKWVGNNIESFGGDKDSITLFGHSAGGIAIGMFCTSPVTRGLFHRAIMESGSPASLAGEDNDSNFRVCQQVAQKVGCADNGTSLRDHPKEVVECLRNKDPFELAETLSKVTKNKFRSYYPQFGDDLLPKNPRQAIADGNFSAVDLLIGCSSGDGGTIILKEKQALYGVYGEKEPLINITLGESLIRENFKDYSDPDGVVRQYLGVVADDDYYAIRRQVMIASGDFARVCPSNFFAESFAAKGAPVYYYFFNHRTSNLPWAPWMLAVHFDEVPLVFGFPLWHYKSYTRGEIALSKRMIQAWSSFAKTGIPSAGKWPLYSKENPVYKLLDVDTSGIGYGLHRSNCDFFRREFGFQ